MSPQELAKEFAHIESTNLLAHTIRNIEDRIFNMTREGDTGYNYHISIRINEDVSKSCCLFAVRGCTIFLPKQASEDLSEEDVRILRLCLAHEIGHILFHLEHILDVEEMKKYYKAKDIQEEASAWEFAYELIKEKSDLYEKNPRDPYIYRDKRAIWASIIGILARDSTQRNKEIREELRRRKVPYA